MIFVIDISMLTHKLYHMSDIDDDVPSWTLHKLERIRLHFKQRFPEIRAFVCAFDNPSRKLWKESVLGQFAEQIYKDGRSEKVELPEIEEGTLEAVNHDADWQAVVAPTMFEADDVIATICRQYSGKVLIHSQDRDYHSLLQQGRVGIVKKSDAPAPGEPLVVEMLSEQGCADPEGKYGVHPSQWIDYQCCVGNKDNVPGWDGVGPKKAKQVLASGKDLLSLDVECPDLKLNVKQRDSYETFRRLYPVIKTVRTPVNYLDIEVRLS